MVDTACWVQTSGKHPSQHTVDRQVLMAWVFVGVAAAAGVDAAAVEDSSRTVGPGEPWVAVVVVVVAAEEEPAAHPLAWPESREFAAGIAGTQETVPGPQVGVAPVH